MFVCHPSPPLTSTMNTRTETAIVASEHDLENEKSDPSTGRFGQVSEAKYAWALTHSKGQINSEHLLCRIHSCKMHATIFAEFPNAWTVCPVLSSEFLKGWARFLAKSHSVSWGHVCFAEHAALPLSLASETHRPAVDQRPWATQNLLGCASLKGL